MAQQIQIYTSMSKQELTIITITTVLVGVGGEGEGGTGSNVVGSKSSSSNFVDWKKKWSDLVPIQYI